MSPSLLCCHCFEGMSPTAASRGGDELLSLVPPCECLVPHARGGLAFAGAEIRACCFLQRSGQTALGEHGGVWEVWIGRGWQPVMGAACSHGHLGGGQRRAGRL